MSGIDRVLNQLEGVTLDRRMDGATEGPIVVERKVAGRIDQESDCDPDVPEDE